MTPEQIKEKNGELFELYCKMRFKQLKLIEEFEKKIQQAKLVKRFGYDFYGILNNETACDHGKKEIEDLIKRFNNEL